MDFSDFSRKVIYKLSIWVGFKLIRKLKSLFYFKTASIYLGKNITIHGLAKSIRVGSQTSFYDNCVFEFGAASDIIIGSHVIFSYGVILACRNKISIGNDVQVGEYTSLRDFTHQFDDLDKPMKYQLDLVDSISIADNVWIGRNCLISPGSIIEEGVVVAAHSLVKGRLEKNGIYGGVPVRLIRFRQ